MNKARYCSAKGSVVARVNHTWMFAVCVLVFIPLAKVLAQDPTHCVTPPSGLVAWWPGDGNVTNLTGANHGTLQNGTTYASGIIGQAFSFNASLLSSDKLSGIGYYRTAMLSHQ